MKIELDLKSLEEFKTIALIARIALTTLKHYAEQEAGGEEAREAIATIRQELRAIDMDIEEDS